MLKHVRHISKDTSDVLKDVQLALKDSADVLKHFDLAPKDIKNILQRMRHIDRDIADILQHVQDVFQDIADMLKQVDDCRVAASRVGDQVGRKRFHPMATQSSRVSLVVTEQDETDLLNVIRQMPERLRTLISLPPNQRRNKRLGPKEEGRARILLRALQQIPSMVPADPDVAGALAKLEVLERLECFDDALQRVAAQVKDTRAGLGMDIMDVVKVGCALYKTFGHKRGLGGLVQDLGVRFGRGKSKKAAAVPEAEE